MPQTPFPLQPGAPLDPALIRALLDHSGQRRLAPWIYRNPRQDETRLPAELEEELKQTYLTTLRHNILLLQELEKLLAAFTETGIPVIPLKGPLLALELYGDLGQRHRPISISLSARRISRVRAPSCSSVATINCAWAC